MEIVVVDLKSSWLCMAHSTSSKLHFEEINEAFKKCIWLLAWNNSYNGTNRKFISGQICFEILIRIKLTIFHILWCRIFRTDFYWNEQNSEQPCCTLCTIVYRIEMLQRLFIPHNSIDCFKKYISSIKMIYSPSQQLVFLSLTPNTAENNCWITRA